MNSVAIHWYILIKIVDVKREQKNTKLLFRLKLTCVASNILMVILAQN